MTSLPVLRGASTATPPNSPVSGPVPPPPPRTTPLPRATRRLADGIYLVFGARNAAVYDLNRGEVHWIEREALEAAERGEATLEQLFAAGFARASIPEALKLALSLSHEGLEEALPIARSRSLRFLWIELTSGCNLTCGHCYASSGGGHRTALSTEGYGRLISDAASLGCETIQFTGGEPLLHPDLLALIDHARGLGIEVEIYSNLTLVSSELASELAARNVRLATSFYSDRASDHEAVTRVQGSFDATVSGIKNALACGLEVRVGVILQGAGYERREQTLAFLVQLGVPKDAIRFDQVRPEGRGLATAAKPAAPGGQRDSCSQAPERRYVRYLQVQSGAVRGTNCWGGELNVTARGEVVPCIFERKLAVGTVGAEGTGLTALATGDRAASIWSIALEDCRVCRDCEFRYSCFDCRFLAFRATGDLYAKPPGCSYDPYTGRYQELSMPETAPRRRENLITEELEGSLVVLDEAKGEAHTLNATAAAVFELLDGHRDLGSIAQCIAAVTGAPLEAVTEDVQSVVRDLVARGLIGG